LASIADNRDQSGYRLLCGRPNIVSEGNVPIAGSSTATGTQIGGGGGTSSGGSFWGDLLRVGEVAGAVGLVTAAAIFG
jgi:hypothetical protein